MQKTGRERADRGHLLALEQLTLDVGQRLVLFKQFILLPLNLGLQRIGLAAQLAAVHRDRHRNDRVEGDEEQLTGKGRPMLHARGAQHTGRHVDQQREAAVTQGLPNRQRQKDADTGDAERQPHKVDRGLAFGVKHHPGDHQLRQRDPEIGQSVDVGRPPARPVGPERGADQARDQHPGQAKFGQAVRVERRVQPDAPQDQDDRDDTGHPAVEDQMLVHRSFIRVRQLTDDHFRGHSPTFTGV